MVIELIEEELPAIVDAKQLFEAPEELLMANNQQPIRMLPPLFPDPPLRKVLFAALRLRTRARRIRFET